MPRYIEIEQLIKFTNEKVKERILPKVAADIAIQVALLCPAADVREVRHGAWYMEQRHGREIVAMMPKTIETVYVCSECGRVERQKEPYCNCGAIMDGE